RGQYKNGIDMKAIVLSIFLITVVTRACTPRAIHTPNPDHRGTQFIGVADFGDWTESRGDADFMVALTSPEIKPRVDWSELIVSWNTRLTPDMGIRVQARVVYPDHTSKWYTLGLWCEGQIVPAIPEHHLTEPGDESVPQPGY